MNSAQGIGEETTIPLQAKVFIVVICAVASVAAAWTTSSMKVQFVEAKVEAVSKDGSEALKRHIELASTETMQLRIQNAEIQGELKAIREVLEMRFTNIEHRLDRMK